MSDWTTGTWLAILFALLLLTRVIRAAHIAALANVIGRFGMWVHHRATALEAGIRAGIRERDRRRSQAQGRRRGQGRQPRGKRRYSVSSDPMKELHR